MNRRAFLASATGLTATAANIEAAPDHQSITVREADGAIHFLVGSLPLCSYQAQPGPLPKGVDPAYARGGYLTNIHSPSGLLVSDDFPPDHLHHHGVWSAWTKCRWQNRDTDFWNMGQKKGRVDYLSHTAPVLKDGRVSLSARHRYTDLTSGQPKPVLDESWSLEIGSLGPHPAAIDLSISQSLIGADPLSLPKYHYGGLGFRGHRSWNGPANTRFLTSEGITDRIKGNESRARWTWIGGLVNTRTAGVLIASHPSNPVHPEPVRLHPSEPFFCFAPPQAGDRSIQPGTTLSSRYLILPLDGEPDAATCQAAFLRWSAPR